MEEEEMGGGIVVRRYRHQRMDGWDRWRMGGVVGMMGIDSEEAVVDYIALD